MASCQSGKWQLYVNNSAWNTPWDFSFHEIYLSSEGNSQSEGGSSCWDESVSSQELNVGQKSLHWDRGVVWLIITWVTIALSAVRVNHLIVNSVSRESVLNLSMGEHVSFVGGQKQERGESIGLISSWKVVISLNISELARNWDLRIKIKGRFVEAWLGNPVPSTSPFFIGLIIGTGPAESTCTPRSKETEAVRVVSVLRDFLERGNIVKSDALVKQVTVGLSIVVLSKLIKSSEHLIPIGHLEVKDKTGIGDVCSIVQITDRWLPREKRHFIKL